MKTITKVAGGLALMAASTAAMATLGIASTKHNLGASGTHNHTDATTEICIFCHTPHGADQSASAPLWNRTLSSSSVYSRYSSLGTTTFDATEAPIGSVSIACLSCHDGTQAMDTVINFPGSDTVPMGPGSYTGHNGWSETNAMSTLKASDNGTTGDMIFLGTDLRNDHPVSMQYGAGGINDANSGTANVTLGDPDYAPTTGDGTTPGAPGNAAGRGGANNVGGSGRVNTKVLGTGTRVWWVDTGGAGQQKNDFTLFSRTDGAGAANGVNQPYVECATCHDPHVTNSTFLRLSGGNAGSQVCLTCHTK
jgi:predicted CXXCH cytochrome family protein